MTNDEFLDHVPYYHGLAWASVGDAPNHDIHRYGRLWFWLSPHYFALADLARRHPEEYAQLVEQHHRTSAERYGVDSWADTEPGGEEGWDVAKTLRAYLKQLEGDDGNSTATSD